MKIQKDNLAVFRERGFILMD